MQRGRVMGLVTDSIITWRHLDAISKATGCKIDPSIYSVAIGKEDPDTTDARRREMRAKRLIIDYTGLTDEHLRIREATTVYNRYSWLMMLRVRGQSDIFRAFSMEHVE